MNSWKKLLRHRLFVTLHDGQAFSAVLLDAKKGMYTFVDIKMATPNGLQPAQGTLYVDPVKIHYCQELPTDAAV